MDVQPEAVSYWSLETIAASSEKRRRKVESHSPPQPEWENNNWVHVRDSRKTWLQLRYVLTVQLLDKKNSANGVCKGDVPELQYAVQQQEQATPKTTN